MRKVNRQNLADIVGLQQAHEQTFYAQCHAGAVRQALLKGAQQALIDRQFDLAALPAALVVVLEARALFAGIRKFVVAVGQFMPAQIQLEAFGHRR